MDLCEGAAEGAEICFVAQICSMYEFAGIGARLAQVVWLCAFKVYLIELFSANRRGHQVEIGPGVEQNYVKMLELYSIEGAFRHRETSRLIYEFGLDAEQNFANRN